jgi:ankyrin repeat protein
MLLTRGADVTARDKKGDTTLLIAAKQDVTENLKTYLNPFIFQRELITF